MIFIFSLLYSEIKMAGRSGRSGLHLDPSRAQYVHDMNYILGNSSIETYNKMNKIMNYLKRFNTEQKQSLIDNIITKCAFIDAENVINNLNNAINSDKTEKKRKYSMISTDLPVIPEINDPVN